MNIVLNPTDRSLEPQKIAETEKKHGAKVIYKSLGIRLGIAAVILLGTCIYKNYKNKLRIREIKERTESSKEIISTTTTCKMRLAEQRHEHRMEEEAQKAVNRKELAQIRRAPRNQMSTQADLVETDLEVQTYDEIISGKEISCENLRIGLRCFHLGEDCGLIGRTNIGKSTWAFQYAINVARGYQTEDTILSEDWYQSQQMTVLYFAFEQGKAHFKVKYKDSFKGLPYLYIDMTTSPNDFGTIKGKIMKLHSQIGDRRLLVVFDNITIMKSSRTTETKKDFFQWLDNYRKECKDNGNPITYLKIYHTNSKYNSNKPLTCYDNYGDKKDIMFTQDLVAFGEVKDKPDQRYLKELKNKLEPNGEKPTVSVYKFGYTEAPLYVYVEEGEETALLASQPDSGREIITVNNDSSIAKPNKRGPKERFRREELIEMRDELVAGFSYREVFEARGIKYDKNKKKGLKVAFNRHNIQYCKSA